VPKFSHGGHILRSIDFDAAVTGSYDCAVVTTDHRTFDYERIAALPLVVDTRNALSGHTAPSIFRL
jgi:UDP-N-acetyl-D-glucosamine dehydrogenase